MRSHLMKGKLFFISTEVTLAETYPRETFLEGLLTTRALYEPEIIFIDSLSTLLSESLRQENLMDITNFFNRLTGSGKIIVVTANQNEWPEDIHRVFRRISDMHCRIAREKMPGIGVVHNIYIEKFNGARKKYEPQTTFSVKPGVGLTIESSGVAF